MYGTDIVSKLKIKLVAFEVRVGVTKFAIFELLKTLRAVATRVTVFIIAALLLV